MSIHYLVDPFTPGRGIIDVTKAEAGGTDSTGGLLIRIPDGTAVHGAPKDLEALLLAKADGLLAYYAGFTSIAYEDCLTASGVQDTNGVIVGAGVANHCLLSDGYLATASVALASAPSVCVVVWEAYSFVNVDPANERFSRVYLEEDSDALECNVSFNGVPGSVTNGVVYNVPAGNQGTDLVLEFTNTSGSRLYLGSWAVIY